MLAALLPASNFATPPPTPVPPLEQWLTASPEIAACYGSDMTEHALNHRFRKLRSQALIIKEGRKKGLDAKGLTADETSLPATKEGVDKTSTTCSVSIAAPDTPGTPHFVHIPLLWFY